MFRLGKPGIALSFEDPPIGAWTTVALETLRFLPPFRDVGLESCSSSSSESSSSRRRSTVPSWSSSRVPHLEPFWGVLLFLRPSEPKIDFFSFAGAPSLPSPDFVELDRARLPMKEDEEAGAGSSSGSSWLGEERRRSAAELAGGGMRERRCGSDGREEGGLENNPRQVR